VPETLDSVCKLLWLKQNNPPQRDKVALINFAGHYGRKKLFEELQATDVEFTFSERLGLEDYYYQLLTHKFVLSPPGRGIDCYRNYEAILFGAYPIIISTPVDEVYKDYPVVIINEWSDLSASFLSQKYKELEAKRWYLGSLFAPYWKMRVERAQKRLTMPENEVHPAVLLVNLSIS
jgi:hypothetical protein